MSSLARPPWQPLQVLWLKAVLTAGSVAAVFQTKSNDGMGALEARKRASSLLSPASTDEALASIHCPRSGDDASVSRGVWAVATSSSRVTPASVAAASNWRISQGSPRGGPRAPSLV